MDLVLGPVILVPKDKSYLPKSHEILKHSQIINYILRKLKQKYQNAES